jgi:flagellar hook assembly protein FlgD
VEIEVFDPRGRRILRESLGIQAQGTHRWTWEGKDGAGAPVVNGVYLCRVRAGQNGEGVVKLFRLGE